MATMSSQSDLHLTRTNLWSQQLKESFEDQLFTQKWVKMISDFPDGDTINIPSIGQAETDDYVEDQPVKYRGLDTGNFTFSIDQYKSSGTYITDKHAQDSFYTQQLVNSFVPKQARAIGKAMEVNALKVGPEAQTATSLNTINGGNHRFVGSGSGETMTIKDFNLANFALNVVNVPMEGRVAIVDPSVEYALTQLTSVTNATNSKWGTVVEPGMMNGLTSLNMNIFGFDVYVSQNLHKLTAGETIDSKSVVAGAACNLFFSTAGDAAPIIGAVRQAPRVEHERNKDYQRDEYVTTARYAHALYRPEGLVTVLTDVDQVS